MLIFKQGVPVYGLSPEILWAADVAERTCPKDCTITSTRFGDEHGWASLHYTGDAIDLRTRHLDDNEIKAWVNELKAVLGDDYDVVLESNHIHIEYQPKNWQEYPANRPMQ